MEFNKNIPKHLQLPQLAAIDKLIERYSDTSGIYIYIINKEFGRHSYCPLCSVVLKYGRRSRLDICLDNCVHSSGSHYRADYPCTLSPTYQELRLEKTAETIEARCSFYKQLRKEYVEYYKLF